MALFLHSKGTRFEPALNLKLFISFYVIFGGIDGSKTGKNGPISAVFLSHENTLFKSSLSSYINPIKAINRTVPEMGQNQSFLLVSILN